MKTFTSFLKIRKSASLWYVLFILMFISCSKPKNLVDFASEVPVSIQRICATDDQFDNLIQKNSSVMQIRNSIEAQTQHFLQSKRNQSRSIDPSGNITIPVVVHVIYNQPDENISLEQIQSQIDVLNSDFNATNPDFLNIPSIFRCHLY